VDCDLAFPPLEIPPPFRGLRHERCSSSARLLPVVVELSPSPSFFFAVFVWMSSLTQTFFSIATEPLFVFEWIQKNPRPGRRGLLVTLSSFAPPRRAFSKFHPTVGVNRDPRARLGKFSSENCSEYVTSPFPLIVFIPKAPGSPTLPRTSFFFRRSSRSTGSFCFFFPTTVSRLPLPPRQGSPFLALRFPSPAPPFLPCLSVFLKIFEHVLLNGESWCLLYDQEAFLLSVC